MRVTVTLDDDLVRELEELTRLTGRSFNEVVNETLRKGLSVTDSPGDDDPMGDPR